MTTEQREIVELRAELTVMRALIATLAAEIALLSPDAKDAMGQFVARAMGFGDAASRGLAQHTEGGSRLLTQNIEQMATWAEGLLPKAVRASGQKTP